MRIIILNQYFYPDHSATSQLMTDLAEDLVERSIGVTALAGRGSYNGGETFKKREEVNGVTIERAWATSFGKGNIVARLADYLSFYLGACWRLLRMPKHDLILVLTTPPMISLVALLVGRLRRMAVITLVQDLYPDVAVALGALKPQSFLTRILDKLNRLALGSAERIIVLGDCMYERVITKTGIGNASRIDVIHNWADGSKVMPLVDAANPFVAEHHLEGKFVVLFSGNFGNVNEFSTVLEAANLLRERQDMLFLFIGEGAKREAIKTFAVTHQLENIKLLPYQPREMLPYSLAAGSIHLVTLAAGLAGLSVPSKLYGSLAAGKPVLFVGDLRSATARIISDNECGATIASGASEELAAIIVKLADDRAKVEEMGRRARQVFMNQFDRRYAVSAYIEAFRKCLEATEPAPVFMDTPHG